MTKHQVNLRFSTDVRTVDLASFNSVYGSVGFGLSPDYLASSDVMDRIFGPGIHGFFAFDGDRLIGAARVFSDDLSCAWIAEICVHPDWQRKGIGGGILDMIQQRFGHCAVYAEAFKEQVGFFIKQGIKPKEKLVACSRAPLKGQDGQ